MKNNVFAGGAYGPTLPAGWTLIGTADFNSDGKTDFVLFNPSTRQTAIWDMITIACQRRVPAGGCVRLGVDLAVSRWGVLARRQKETLLD